MFCAALTEALARSSSAARCASVGSISLLDPVNRQAGNIAAVLTAHLRPPVGRRIGGPVAGTCVPADSQSGHRSRRARTGRRKCHHSRSPRTRRRRRCPRSHSRRCRNRRTARTAGRPIRIRRYCAATIPLPTFNPANPAPPRPPQAERECRGCAARPRCASFGQMHGSSTHASHIVRRRKPTAAEARSRKRSAPEVTSAAAKMRMTAATEMRMAAAVAASMTTSTVAASAMPAAASRDGIASGQNRQQSDGGNPDIEFRHGTLDAPARRELAARRHEENAGLMVMVPLWQRKRWRVSPSTGARDQAYIISSVRMFFLSLPLVGEGQGGGWPHRDCLCGPLSQPSPNRSRIYPTSTV